MNHDDKRRMVLREVLALACLVPCAVFAGCSSSSGTSNPAPEAATTAAPTGQVPPSSGQPSADAGDAGTTGPADDGGVPPQDGAPSGGSPWAGVYACTVAESVTVTAPLATTLDTTNTADMTITESGTTLTANFTGDGGLACVLTFADDGGGSAVLTPATGQGCNVTANSPIGPVPVTVTFTAGGTATLSGASLKADNLAISAADGPGGTLGIKGTGTLSADCTSH